MEYLVATSSHVISVLFPLGKIMKLYIGYIRLQLDVSLWRFNTLSRPCSNPAMGHTDLGSEALSRGLSYLSRPQEAPCACKTPPRAAEFWNDQQSMQYWVWLLAKNKFILPLMVSCCKILCCAGSRSQGKCTKETRQASHHLGGPQYLASSPW